MTKLMTGKRGVVMGLANDKSLAWGICQQLHAAGAELAITHMGGPMLKRVEPLAAAIGNPLLLECDVNDDAAIASAVEALQKQWGTLDFMVHAIAFAHKGELQGGITNTTREGFQLALETSAYSLLAVVKAAKDILSENSSIVTLTYLGSEKVVPNYNVMGVAKAALEAEVRYLAAELGQDGVRVNGLSAGPVKTLAASGIGGFRDMLTHHEQTAPLKRLTTQEDVGRAAVYLLSDLSQGVTGEIHYVDGGANVLGPVPS